MPNPASSFGEPGFLTQLKQLDPSFSHLQDPEQLKQLDPIFSHLQDPEKGLAYIAGQAKQLKPKTFEILVTLALNTPSSVADVILLNGLADLTAEKQELLIQKIVDARDKPSLISIMIQMANLHEEKQPFVLHNLPKAKDSLSAESLKILIDTLQKNKTLDRNWKDQVLAILDPQSLSPNDEPISQLPDSESAQVLKRHNAPQGSTDSPPLAKRHRLAEYFLSQETAGGEPTHSS